MQLWPHPRVGCISVLSEGSLLHLVVIHPRAGCISPPSSSAPSPIVLTVAKCWDPSPQGYFTLPRSAYHPVPSSPGGKGRCRTPGFSLMWAWGLRAVGSLQGGVLGGEGDGRFQVCGGGRRMVASKCQGRGASGRPDT